MLTKVFPEKKHPEDRNAIFALVAKLIFWSGIFFLLWSSYYLLQWGRSRSFLVTEGRVEFGALGYVQTHVTNVSFDYSVDGEMYTSQNIAIGGRPFGSVPGEGPVIVYYNPNDPSEAVLLRRPAEVVILAFFFAIIAPFLARYIWTTYA